jgi:hypothetical protein
MDVHALSHSSRFADRVARMLERVEHRPALCRADREAAYRLRYEAYLRENLLNPRVDAILYDEVYDDSPNSLTMMTYFEGELASTVRVQVVADEFAASPACDVFPDVLAPHLRAHRVIIEPSRLAARADVAMRFPELPYFAVRPPWLAAHHFNADFIVLSCAIGHVGYYRRTFGAQIWSDSRSYPKVTAKVVCVGHEFGAKRDSVEARYPSFRSTPAEREAIFGELASSLALARTLAGANLARVHVQQAKAK